MSSPAALSASLVQIVNLDSDLRAANSRLRYRLKLVEDLWESVLLRESGQELVDLLRQLRAMCSPEGQAPEYPAQEVLKVVESLDLQQATTAARAFALFFQLINIVEQDHFVKEGKQTFADEHLKFYYTIEECLKEQQINLFLLGSVLQYIEKPYELLDIILSKKIAFFHLDRTPIFKNNTDRITVQKVHKSIYDAQYPCWIFNETKLINYICNSGYELIFDAEPNERINVTDAYLKGYYFKLKP
jgi:hypothetical protein